MKIVLAGSPAIALDTFTKVINNFDVVAIITQPDRRQGRGQKLQATAIADLGARFKIPVKKPEKVMELHDYLQALDYDVLLTFAYGQILPAPILETAQLLPVNVHGSLLPKYRGAAPIQQAILDGEQELGVCLIEMVQKMDAGDILFSAKQTITEATSAADGFRIISELASKHITDWLAAIKNGSYTRQSQGDSFTLAPKINKADAEITGTDTISMAQRKIKAYNPFPGAFTFIDGKRVKLFDFVKEPAAQVLSIKCQDGTLYVNDYQFASKSRISI